MRAQQDYNAGIYCRLSVDDGTDSESMSIGNQKHMLMDYVLKQGWNISEIYIDDGWSGVNFERPDFKRMISDIEGGRINLVIVKDLSRLGRNYILCGQFTEIYFPERNVRFIALNDGIDSLNNNNDIAPFKNILNDMYAKDISVKVRSALYAKAKRGEYLGSCDPYGYIRDPDNKHHLVINPETASVVKRIFEMCVSGYGLYKIARILNNEGALSPSDYGAFKKFQLDNGEFMPKVLWHESMIRLIIRNEMFIGNMVQCRKRSQSYRTQKIVWNPQEDWVVVKNTHEPIVSEELFKQAQKHIEGRTRFIKKNGEPHIFNGLLFCAACGRRMLHHVRKTSRGDYFTCGKYSRLGKMGCTSHYITVNDIYEIVLKDIQANIVLDQSDEDAAIKMIISSKCADDEKHLTIAKIELAKQSKQQFDLDARIKKAYEDNVSGKLPDDLFKMFLNDYESEKLKAAQTIKAIENEIKTLDNAKANASSFLSLLKQYTDVTALDRYILNNLISRIDIAESPENARKRNQTVFIYYKCRGNA